MRKWLCLWKGPTEQQFVKQLLAPYMADLGVYLTPIILDKPGEKGGDVKFSRARTDIGKHLKQRKDTWVTPLASFNKGLHGIAAKSAALREACRWVSHNHA